jgi:type II secretion system protein G
MVKQNTKKIQNSKFHIPNSAFTLIELLVVISIVAILMGLSFFGLMGARESSRDSKRKADLESIRSGIEIYKSDCNAYPTSNVTSLTTLVGSGSPTSCAITNTYMSTIPTDPTTSTRSYRYSSDGTTYYICAALEQGSGSVSCGGNCGTVACNYKVVNP